MRRLGRRFAWAVAAVLAAGCAEAPLAAIGCDGPTFSALVGPLGPIGLTRAEGTPIPSLVFVRNDAAVPLKLILPDDPRVEAAPKPSPAFRTTVLAGEDPLPPNGSVFARVEFDGTPAGEYPPFVIRASLADADPAQPRCANRPTAYRQVTFVGTPEGEVARPGVGALVHTAGFWSNGTLFYTNMDRVHNDTAVPRSGWYEFEGGAPLKVYVYNTSREETPPRYNESGFVTTIVGFNEALKGLSTSGARIADLPPEEAYTRPGNEAHPLYGDRLVFFIELRDVEAVSCPYPEPVCELPDPT